MTWFKNINFTSKPLIWHKMIDHYIFKKTHWQLQTDMKSLVLQGNVSVELFNWRPHLNVVLSQNHLGFEQSLIWLPLLFCPYLILKCTQNIRKMCVEGLGYLSWMYSDCKTLEQWHFYSDLIVLLLRNQNIRHFTNAIFSINTTFILFFKHSISWKLKLQFNNYHKTNHNFINNNFA